MLMENWTAQWTIGDATCTGCEDIFGPQCPQDGKGAKHSASYTIKGDTATIIEEETPPEEFGCPSARQEMKFTKQN